MAAIREFFSAEDTKELLGSLAGAEARTTGVIRIRVEKKAGKDPLAKARQAFEAAGLRNTGQKNNVMLYISVEDRKFAVLGDDGINAKVNPGFWDNVRDAVTAKFRQKQFSIGLIGAINMTGDKLAEHFPADKEVNDILQEGISYEE